MSGIGGLGASWLLLGWATASAVAGSGSNASAASAAAVEVRLLFVVHSYSEKAVSLRALELAASHLEQHWASADSSAPRKAKVRVLNAGDSSGAAAAAVLAEIDQFEPCAVLGSTSLNTEVTHMIGHVAMEKNLLFVPGNDAIARSVLDHGSYRLTVNVQGITLGGATFLSPFMNFMKYFGWKRAVVLVDATAGNIATEMYDETSGLDIQFVFMTLELVSFENEIDRVLDIIHAGHYSIIGVSLPAAGHDQVLALFGEAAKRGLDGEGYQWCMVATQSSLATQLGLANFFGIRSLREMFYFYPSMYEPESLDPATWSSGLVEPLYAAVPSVAVWMYSLTEPARLVCDLARDCLDNWNSGPPSGVVALSGYAVVYIMGSIASSLLDRGQCGSAEQRMNATPEDLIQAVLDQEFHPLVDVGPIQFERVPSGVSRASTVVVCVGEDYHSYPDVPYYTALAQMKTWRSVAVISRQGDVHLMDAWTNLPVSSFPAVFGRPFTFMNGTVTAPRDYIPDSCGPTATVNGSSCVACAYGTALPMNGTNACLPAAEECKVGYVWSFEDVQCEPCMAGTFASNGSCQACPRGRWSSNSRDVCELCSAGYYMSPGTSDCLFCTAEIEVSFMPYVARINACVLELNWPLWILQISAWAFAATRLLGQLRFGLRRPWISGRLIHIEDISWRGDHLVVAVFHSHKLMQGRMRSFSVSFQSTGCRKLDAPGAKFLGKVVSGDRIVVAAKAGESFSMRFEAAQGTFHLSAWETLLSTGHFLPLLLELLLLTAVALVAVPFLSYFEHLLGVGMAWLVGVLASWYLKRRTQKTSLEKLLDNYREEHASDPVRAVRGPDRAIGAGRLVKFHESFQSIIKYRSMYFVWPNVGKHLTDAHKCSLAEVVGPKRVDFFCSHWWGEEFSYTVASIRNHAKHPSVCKGDAWESVAYWICTFANNQYAVDEELGEDICESSFYITLRSGSCRGTCLILREHAEPLKRSWCLFEFIQTMDLQESGVFPNFEGLFFCTASGVMNFGKASVELSLRIGARLAELRLEDAQASRDEDKRLIDKAVETMMGGFEATNVRLRAHINEALHASKASADAEFAGLFGTLSRDIGQNTAKL